ncbi:MAG TPA: ABC transporter substrate-binding protein [Thermoanaerobaculia bacterium]|nr:ABC transporter substrate-binding protein [Thermoanaerobaculia bacterium]
MRLAALSLALLLASCSSPDDAIRITISASAVGREGEVLERQLRRFEQLHPGMRVLVQRTPDDATQRHQLYVQWLNARLGSPDVLQIDVVWTPELAAAGWLLPLDRFAPDEADMFDASLAANRWRGSLFAVPWFLDAGMLYWRSDLMPSPPSTLGELERLARAARASGEARHGIVWQGARYEGLITVFLEILTAHGGTILDEDGRPALDSEAARRALEFLRSLIESGVTPREVLTWQEEQTRFAFQNGTSAMMRNWPYAVGLLSDPADSAVAGRFEVAPIPAAPGGRPAAALGGAQLAINRWSAQPDAAWRLVAFLTAPEQMLERAGATSQYPARASLYGSARLDAALGTDSSRVRAILDAAVPRPVTPVWSEMSEAIQIELHGALAGRRESAEALVRANRACEAILARAGLAERRGAH